VTDGPTADDFPEFFRAVHGVEPFPWQTRLLRDWVAGPQGWPSVLDLPTGSGKTAALDVTVFHLAMEAEKGAARRAPVRIAFVVDRRLIVDDAYLRAKRIEAALASAARDPGAPNALRKVALRLAFLAEQAERPLIARRMRGGVPREDDWARTPHQPTILCSTVDQVGSRLLFRGYGVSPSMRPVHAGLLGSDCLILLDEAHLSEPLRQTLEAIARQRADQSNRESGPEAIFGLALLTATPGRLAEATFGLAQEDRDHVVLRRRLRAAKPATLVPITAKKDESRSEAEHQDEGGRVACLSAAVASALDHLAKQPLETQPVVGIVVNRVLRARGLFRRLREIYGGAVGGPPRRADVLLLIGPAREVDSAEVASRLEPIKTGRDSERQALTRSCIVVATQTIEAGVDLDFDALITEIASFDALRQRFGRLNRAGRSFIPYAAILADREDTRPGKGGDAIYGQAAAETWAALRELAGSSRGGAVDFAATPSEGMPWVGTIPLSEIVNRRLLAPTEDAPVLMPAYVDLWSQTSPAPAADPEVGFFLHGPDRSPANVQIVWRADLEFGREGFDAPALLAAMPPKPAEAVEVSLAAARRWLRPLPAERSAVNADFADAPGLSHDLAGADSADRERPALRWAGPESGRTGMTYARDLRPNDLVVVPADYGGCDEFGWDPSSEEAVRDVADEAAERFAARRFALRLTPRLIESGARALPDDADAEAERSHVARFAAAFMEMMAEVRDGHLRPEARSIVSALISADPPPAFREPLNGLLSSAGRARLQAIFPYGEDEDERPRGVVLVAPKGIAAAASKIEPELEGGIPATEDDLLSSTSGSAETLDEHSRRVRDRAAGFADKAGLHSDIADDVALAAYLHDAGKADPRFQTMLYGGDWFAVDDARILAKSAHSVASAREKAGLPEHWRHEALSVRIAQAHSRFRGAHDPELVLWLIGVHHGYGRPFFPHPDEPAPGRLPDVLGGLHAAPGPGPQSLSFSFEGQDWPQIFERLKRRYGVWELARLEAIVRLADHRASEAAALEAAGRECQ
jgi:CRISPR-associated endonuclease/helicase Cas3